MGAISSAMAGCSVLVLESESSIGGSTSLSGGYVTMCGTPLEDGTADQLYEDLMESHLQDCSASLNRAYADNASAMFEKLRQLNVKFVRTVQFPHMSRAWAHELSGEGMNGGAEIVARLSDRCRALGVEIRTSARVNRLTSNEGRVTGVLVDGERFDARSGVIIAAGGFTRNPEMVKTFGVATTENILPVTGPGSRGDGIKFAQALGGDLSYMTSGIAPTVPAEPNSGTGVLVLLSGAIALNKDGERFCNESGAYTDTCWTGLGQPNGLMIQMYDKRIRDRHLETMLGKALSGYDEYTADTLDELIDILSKECGLDRDAATATIHKYNVDIANGTDLAFGRVSISGNLHSPQPLMEGPFFAVPTYPGTTHFNGGIRVNDAMAVIDVFGEPISGLFAAGEVTGGFHGAGYMSGSFVGMALIFGDIAGQSVSAPA